jgi:hypothetical protein
MKKTGTKKSHDTVHIKINHKTLAVEALFTRRALLL